MYSLALFIVELQTAKGRLITIFEEPHDTSKARTLPFTRNGEHSREEQVYSSGIISRPSRYK
jgi:hypothetical protein